MENQVRATILLHDVIVQNSVRIVELTERRRSLRSTSPRSPPAFDAVPAFLAHLVDALAPATSAHALGVVLANTSRKIKEDAEQQGRVLQRRGCSVAQLVSAYGDICQVLTELASEGDAGMSARDFGVLNRCLDDAVASALTAHGLQRERFLAREELYRQKLLAYELTNLLNVATLSFESVSDWPVSDGQARQALHAQSLAALRGVVNRSVNDARDGSVLAPRLELVVVEDLLSDVTAGAAMQASERGLTLTVLPASHDIAVAGDRHLLTSAIWSLLQNAFELTRAHGEVLLRATATQARVSIDVCDQCGGLPGKVDCLLHLLQNGARRDSRRSGLGLAIAWGAAQAHLGDLHVRDVPGEGCVYTLDLPRHQPSALPPALGQTSSQR
jgi:signal transduction histidine kinase